MKLKIFFLTKNGYIKLGGFGSASDNIDLAKNTILSFYKTPEYIKNNTYTIKSDKYQLGILLYEMVTLEKPFEANNLLDLIKEILKGEYNPIPNNYSKKLEELIS